MKELVTHPSTFFKVFEGTEKVSLLLDQKRVEQWLKHPIQVKKLRNFSIYLHLKDKTGPSASIGADGLYEPAETALMVRLLRKNMTVIDVGANLGWYTLLAASKVGLNGKVVAFEPEPENFNLLSKSIRLNGFTNVVLRKLCVSNYKGKSVLWLAQDNLGGHSLTKRENMKESIKVKTTTLNDDLPHFGIQHIDILKVDAEGAEPQVLEGVQQTALKDIDHIMLEWRHDSWCNKQTLLHTLFMSYQVFRIVKSPFLIQEIQEIDMHKVKFTNLYLKRRP